jgi:hypothetical protein
MKLKYATVGKKQKGQGGKGRYADPDRWVTGPDLERREKYYAYLKHKSQANYRGELYLLTWEDWEYMWTTDLWRRRGRRITDLCLTQLEWGSGWSMDNVTICTRREHFKLKKANNARRQRAV